MEHVSSSPLPKTSESISVLETSIQSALQLTDKEREAYLKNAENMQKLRGDLKEGAATVIAALLVGNSQLLWSDGVGSISVVQPESGSSEQPKPSEPQLWGYRSTFLTIMKDKQSSPIEPVNFPMKLLCFEGVLYAMYLGGLLQAGAIVKLLTKSLTWKRAEKKSMLLQQKDWKNFRELWAVFTNTNSAPLKLMRPEVLSVPGASKELFTPGLLVFLGPSLSGIQFDFDVPWHVGVIVGQGNFIGLPGIKGNQQSCENIVDHAQGKESLVAFGTSLAEFAQRVEAYIN